MFRKSFISFFVFNFCVILVSGLSEGEQCTTRMSQTGICTSVPDCPQIVNDLRQGKRNHVVCGYKGFSQIVCCPRVVPAVVTLEGTTSNRISARKCNEYKETAYNKISVVNVFNTPAIQKKVSNCAYVAVPLIVGGTEAKKREFPHMALIGFRDGNKIQWNCGGSLISEQFVLSAAHCFDSRLGPPRYVRLGEHDTEQTFDASPVDLDIIERIPHPEYKYPIQYNDIGLFKLARRVQFNSAIRPICLPEESTVPTRHAIATGWGAVQWKDVQSNVLLKVTLDMFSQNECNSSYSSTFNRKLNRGIVEETQVCAGSYEEDKDTCQGDSGGPLQIYHEEYFCTYTIVGVTSFGKICATKGVPGVYTRVYAYLDWIESVVWPNQ